MTKKGDYQLQKQNIYNWRETHPEAFALRRKIDAQKILYKYHTSWAVISKIFLKILL